MDYIIISMVKIIVVYLYPRDFDQYAATSEQHYNRL